MRISDWSSDVCSSDLIRSVERRVIVIAGSRSLAQEAIPWLEHRRRLFVIHQRVDACPQAFHHAVIHQLPLFQIIAQRLWPFRRRELCRQISVAFCPYFADAILLSRRQTLDSGFMEKSEERRV